MPYHDAAFLLKLYFWYFHFADPVSEVAHYYAACTLSSSIITNGLISSTCYINRDHYFNDPVNEPVHCFAIYTLGAGIISDSSNPATGFTV